MINVLRDLRLHGRRRAPTALAAVLVMAAACDTETFLEVDAPSLLPAEELENPANAALLVNGAIADFECAYGAFVTVQGIMSDELVDAQLGAAAWFYDRRDAGTNPASAYGVNGCNSAQTPGVYRPVSTARWSADNVLHLLTDVWERGDVVNYDALMARSALYAGFSYTMLGMAMCTAAIDGGPEVTSASLLGSAETRFTTAIQAAGAAGLDDVATAAQAGRARVRLYLGDDAGAQADAEAVPLDFSYNATFSQDNSRRYNRVFHSNILSTNYSIEAQSRGLTTGGVEDPRTLTFDAGTNANDGTTLWVQDKYTDYGTPIPIVTGGEALLIRAEIEGGSAAVGYINQLRGRWSLPTFSSGDPDEIRDALVEERRRELWLQGHRQYDMARFNVPLSPVPGTPYPKGGLYGSTTCLPLPDVERFNNPNIP
ncbi:MAG TPA: RagB/SusD family nutrient uptake outer membrane protein [Longimicrobiales bacterium]|nr:RagB/SusD family nutrient uptake outer membrane protein [Longimicrobiales bacterium]